MYDSFKIMEDAEAKAENGLCILVFFSYCAMCIVCCIVLQLCIINTRKCGIHSDVLPIKAAQRDNISNSTFFEVLNLSCRQTQWRFIYCRCGAPR